ncbi:uncharacterized protein N7483_010085 [Penicillium malachiteum]|uniref:uncharacterized protein n=1 Tax=Penicillium malachiteum TaxID=1324776 RepID=UPI0025498250|nr:uncharacterized protein N7483_010085 [Penicillium malachiteum]KAJ5712904.1 hypothetical protein N7483_010085 [Penicillium malachiteum]
MRSDVGFDSPGPTPIQTASAKTRLSAAFFSTHNNGQYVELDDLGVATSPVLNDDAHYPSTPKKQSSKMYMPNTLWTRLFAMTGIIETLGTVGIESWIFISISNHFDNAGDYQGTLRLRSFLGLYIFALLYELALSYDALRRKNTFQLMGLCICNMGLLVYGIIQTKEIKDTLTSLSSTAVDGNDLWNQYRVALILVPVVLAVGTICLSIVTWKLRAEFSWTIYKSISADLQMSWRYTTYQVYIALLKFDFFFIFGTQLQVLLAIQHVTDNQFIVQAAMIPIAVISLALAARFCRLEKKKSLICMMLLMVVIIASFILTLVQMFGGYDGEELGSYRVSLTLFASLAMLLLAVTLVNSIMCICNFNKGLRHHIDNSRKRKPAADPEDSWTQDTKSRFVLN